MLMQPEAREALTEAFKSFGKLLLLLLLNILCYDFVSYIDYIIILLQLLIHICMYILLGDSTGRLSLEHFRQSLLHFGYGGETNAAGSNVNQHSGTALVHLCKIIDRDGDGYISPEDIFTTQVRNYNNYL